MFHKSKRERAKRGPLLRRGTLCGACAVALTAGVAIPAAQASQGFYQIMY
jgi:hypothetical protein